MSQKTNREVLGQAEAFPLSRWFPFLILAAGFLVYLNSFQAPFVFDGERLMLEEERFHQLWPVSHVVAPKGVLVSRFFTDLTLAVNYALGGENVWGYHLVNIAVHVATALFLFSLIRRTLRNARHLEGYAEAADYYALAVSLLWVVHPLHTQSVTYLIQRYESMMGLFYVMTLYFTARGATSHRSGKWYFAAVISCALGMGCKQVMVTAPIVVFLYDRIFLASSLQQILKKRSGLYFGFLITWWIFAEGVLQNAKIDERGNAGFSLEGISPLDYLLSQPGVLFHYLRLSFWPEPLVLDYDWPVAAGPGEVLFPLVLVTLLFLGGLYALAKKPAVGFLIFSFFLILAPTSSIMPLKDLAMEHRMYLPLIPVMALAVFGVDAVIKGMTRKDAFPRWGWLLVFLVVFVLGALTVRRNRDYRSDLVLWEDTVQKRPLNARAHYSYGRALAEEMRMEEAKQQYEFALELKPDYRKAHNNLGNMLAGKGEYEKALKHYQASLQLDPENVKAIGNIGLMLMDQGRNEEAVFYFKKALTLDPGIPRLHYLLGSSLRSLGRTEEANRAFAAVLKLSPDFVSENLSRMRNLIVKAEQQGQPQLAADYQKQMEELRRAFSAR